MQNMPALTNPSYSWTDLAATMLKALSAPRNRSWMFVQHTRPTPLFDCDDDKFGEPLPDLDTLLSEAEDDTDIFNTHTPRSGPLIALLRLARTFETLENFWATLTAPGAILLLTTGHPEHDKLIADALKKLTNSMDDWPPRREPQIFLLKDATKSSLIAETRAGSLDDLSQDFRAAFETGAPLVLIGASVATLPKSLLTLSPHEIRLAPIDQKILFEFLRLSFTKEARAVPDKIKERLADAKLEILTLTDLVIAQRAPCMLDAVKVLCVETQPAAQMTGHSLLQDFPLPANVREALDQMIEDMRLWRVGQLDWADVMRGILLHGPTGSGKTEIARLLAKETGLSVHAGSLSKWMSSGSRSGETTREMRKFFEAAATDAPCVIFVDELDALGDRDRPHDHNSSWTDGIVTAFLECVDGFEQMEGVILLAATNHVEKLDAAILRPGRFDRLLKLSYPSREMLPQVFRWHLKRDLKDADLSNLSNRAIGMSGAVISGLVREARARARRQKHPLTLDDLDAVLAVYRPERPLAHRHLIAVHEAGHAIVAAATGAFKPISVVIMSDGGMVEQKPIKNVLYREHIEAEIKALLAGRAAEKLVFGRSSGGAGGNPDSDLARATQRATALELSHGLGSSGPVWLGSPHEMVAYLRRDPAMRGIIQQRLVKLEAAATSILLQNRDVLDNLTVGLLREGFIQGEAFDRYVSRVRGTAEREDESEKKAEVTSSTA